MLNFQVLKSKLFYLVEQLSSRPKIGGLQINNANLQFILIENNKPKTAVLHLAPGTLADGRIKNREEFLKAITQFYRDITGAAAKKKEKIKVIVSLPAEVIFNQNFSIPNVGSENLKEAARLNLQMISPLPSDKSYSDWQIINETPDKYELLGVLAEKEIIDEFSFALIEGGFLPIAFEYPALSLTRFINKFANLNDKTVLVIDVSSDGIDLFILKNNRLYFDHFRSWHSIQGEERQITKAAFEDAIFEETQRVLNFSASRFRENLDKVIVFASGLEENIKNLLTQRFNLSVLPFQSNAFTAAGPSWFTAAGASLRGLEERGKDIEINLSSIATAENFYQEQTISFIALWRNILLTVGAFFLAIFIISDVFLTNYLKNKQSYLSSFNAQPSIEELNFLVGQARDFNNLVSMIEKSISVSPPFKDIISSLKSLADKDNVSIQSIDIVAPGAPVRISGQAPNNIVAIQFKNDLSAAPNFKDVDLPFTGITTLADNSVAFTMSFEFSK